MATSFTVYNDDSLNNLSVNTLNTSNLEISGKLSASTINNTFNVVGYTGNDVVNAAAANYYLVPRPEQAQPTAATNLATYDFVRVPANCVITSAMIRDANPGGANSWTGGALGAGGTTALGANFTAPGAEGVTPTVPGAFNYGNGSIILGPHVAASVQAGTCVSADVGGTAVLGSTGDGPDANIAGRALFTSVTTAVTRGNARFQVSGLLLE